MTPVRGPLDRLWRRSPRSRSSPGGVTGTISCVVDQDPRFHLDALRWFASLTAVAGVDPSDLVVHVVGRADTDALATLRAKGVRVRPIEAFDARSPHCNKVAGALALAASGVTGLAVLSDADVVFCADPRTVEVAPGSVAAKPVDAPQPSLEVLDTVFSAAGVAMPAPVPLDFYPGATTVAGNGNGGLYLVPGTGLAAVATAWAGWARWLLERRSLLGPFGTFVDQVAMALALADRRIGAQRLPVRWNTPTHVPEWLTADAERPLALHYHGAVEVTGLLTPPGVPVVDEQVGLVNRAIADLWQDAFPNATFWEWRYRTNPELGSGLGSRGEVLTDKRAMVTAVLDRLGPGSVLDVGCGDGEALRGLPLPRYTGLDLSEAATRLAQVARPDGTFVVGALTDHPVHADLTVCLDVLIHQPDRSTYDALTAALVASADRALLVSGYERPPDNQTPMIHFHEPLSTSLRRLRPDASLEALREAHEITTWLARWP